MKPFESNCQIKDRHRGVIVTVVSREASKFHYVREKGEKERESGLNKEIEQS